MKILTLLIVFTISFNSLAQDLHWTSILDLKDSMEVKEKPILIKIETAWCGYCKKAKKYFQKKGIPFVEYDIEKNARAKRDYDAIGGKGVPVIVMGKKRMNGFSVAGFERFYK